MHEISFIYVKGRYRKYVSIDNIFAVTDTAVKVSKQEILSQIVFVETFLEDIVTFLLGTLHQGRRSITSKSNIRKHTTVISMKIPYCNQFVLIFLITILGNIIQ